MRAQERIGCKLEGKRRGYGGLAASATGAIGGSPVPQVFIPRLDCQCEVDVAERVFVRTEDARPHR